MPGQPNWGLPLRRNNPFYPGQWGVRGSFNELGERYHTTGAIFYVDPNHAGANDSNDGTDPDHPLLTVAQAITLCAPARGDVIAVMANNGWQYGDSSLGNTVTIAEEVTLDVPGVRLIGVAPAGTVGVVWSPVTAAGAGTCITVTGSDCLIEGFAFQGGLLGGTAISIQWDGATLYGDNVKVQHCLFDDDIDDCIVLVYSWQTEISDCYFLTPDGHGIYCDPAGSAPSMLSIHHNNFYNCTTGAIVIAESTESLIYENWIYDTDAQNEAAAANQGIDTSAGTGNLVCNNWFSCRLPKAANGDWNDFNSGDSTDAWIGNHCMDGDPTTIPT